MGGINGALASIRKIERITPIEGADNIEVVSILGWNTVTQKANNFKVGDLVVYFSIDSLLPICEQFSFLEKYRVSERNSVNGEGYRLKTIKLRGTLSQGLILPITSLFEITESDGEIYINIPEQAISEDRNGIDLQDP